LLKIVALRNRNTYLEFQDQLESFDIFNIKLVSAYFSNFDSKRFNEWQKKGYIKKLIKGWYAFAKADVTELSLFRWSNVLRKPSYISLESAFTYYGFIPEQTFEIKSVTTLKTISYTILNRKFTYNTLATRLFFGYNIIVHNQKPVALAFIEKAIIDYLYLNSDVSESVDFEALRWNKFQKIDWVLFDKYLCVFKNNALNNRAKQFKNYML
jgi:predicted transcriptional regulator of viral defense system